MTKKDYILIALCFERENGEDMPTVYSLANRLAVELQMENPRFDREKFLKACGF